MFGKLVRASGDGGTNFTTYSKIDYTSTEELSTASGQFAGDAITDGNYDTELALYPVNKTNGANLGFPTEGTIFKLTLQETLTYDKDNTLKDIVPMVGKMDGNGDYIFKPLTGVLAIEATNIPTTANKITISSTGKALSGTTGNITGKTDASYKTSLISQLYDAEAGLPMSWFSGTATKSYSFSGLDPANTYTFYFPIPTGTLLDLTIKFYRDATLLYTVTSSKSITITRGHITPLSLITMPQYKVTVGGTATEPNGTFYRENATVFFTISNSSATLAKGDYIDGMKFTHDPSQANDNTITWSFAPGGSPRAGLSNASGKYYLHYLVAPVKYKGDNCSKVDDGDIIARGQIPFYYLASGDTGIAGTYSYTGSVVWGGEETVSWTFAVSDDCLKGNLKITGTSIWSLSGNIYGVYNGSSSITIDGRYTTFTSSTTHCIIGDWSASSQGSPAVITDIVFAVDGSNLVTSKIGIGYSTTVSSGAITSSYLSSRFFDGETIWTKQ